MTSPGLPMPATGVDLVALRPLVVAPIEARFALRPGDRVLVSVGDQVAAGMPIAERLRDAHLVEVDGDLGDARPGDRWSGELPRRPGAHGHGRSASGELLFASGGRSRIATGEHDEPIESPIDGVVADVRPGIGIVVRASGPGLAAVDALGGPSRGTLTIATGPDGELRPGAVDAAASGRVLVVGSRVDAETLTRARAMGVRGIVVAGLAGKERRDYLGSEARQRAALHRLPPFAVLVLDGALRRPIASPVMAVLAALSGREVGIVADPPRLVFEGSATDLPAPDPGWVRARSGPLAGREGRWAGLAGVRRFDAGTHLEAGLVRFDDAAPVPVPLADLERYA